MPLDKAEEVHLSAIVNSLGEACTFLQQICVGSIEETQDSRRHARCIFNSTIFIIRKTPFIP